MIAASLASLYFNYFVINFGQDLFPNQMTSMKEMCYKKKKNIYRLDGETRVHAWKPRNGCNDIMPINLIN